MCVCSAATVALGTSIINILLLTLYEEQLGWVCLASCGVDVVINSMAICSITHSSKSTSGSESPVEDNDQALHPMSPPTSPPLPNIHESRQTRSSMHSTSSGTVRTHKRVISSPFKGLGSLRLPAFACRSGGRPTLPLYKPHRQSAYLDTQSANGSFSLSKIGDFAVTQDDPTGLLGTRRGSTALSDGHQRNSIVDVRRRSGEQTVLATIRKPLPALPPSSERGSLYSVRSRKNSYGYEAIRNVVQVSPMLQKTHSLDLSTSTKEFEETGTKIEFRSPLEINEE
jgi:hypothetical protein